MQSYHTLMKNADVSNYLKRKSGIIDVKNDFILSEPLLEDDEVGT